MLVATYPYTLILGPSLIIILAVNIALLMKLPALRRWLSPAMALIGAVEVSYVPVWAFWVFLVGLTTLILGIVMCANGFLPRDWRAKIGLSFTALGVIEILLFFGTFWGFVIGLGTLVFGVAAGSTSINPRSRRAKLGVVLLAVGAAVILAAIYANFVGLAFFVGASIFFAGIAVGVAALPFWTQNQLKENRHYTLRKIVYASLAMVIVVSGSVIFVRATNVVHEQFLETYSGGSTPNLTLRGVITEVRFNYEVNNGYSYHIFPAYVVMDVKEFVWGTGFWENQTAARDYWLNEAKTAVVYYEKTDVPDLTVGQRIEVNGYYNIWTEDSLYSEKLVVAPNINGSYVTPL